MTSKRQRDARLRAGLDAIDRDRTSGAKVSDVIRKFIGDPEPMPATGIPTAGTVPAGHSEVYPGGTVPTAGIPITGTVRGYTRIPNAILDELLRTLTAPEQLVYLRLYRLSHGFERDTCAVGYITLGKSTNLGRNTVRRAVEGLVAKRLIVRREEGAGASHTTYTVMSPSVPTTGTPRVGIPAKGIPGAGTVPTVGPMKGKIQRHEERPAVAVAPSSSLSVYDVRTIAARFRELHHGESDYTKDRLRADVRSALVGQGIEPDEHLINEAIGA